MYNFEKSNIFYGRTNLFLMFIAITSNLYVSIEATVNPIWLWETIARAFFTIVVYLIIHEIKEFVKRVFV
jgi:hypothetical protein